jgi:hypothetical protein
LSAKPETRRAVAVVELIAQLVPKQVRRVDDLPENIELLLGPGVVPYPHRAAVPEASQMLQRVLGQVPFALDAVHDLHLLLNVGRMRADRAVDPVKEPLCLVGAGRDPQRPQGQAQIPQPGVAVIPVVAGPARLGQGGGRRGRHGSRRLVGQRLEHQGAAPDLIYIRPLVTAVHLRPGPPPLAGVLHSCFNLQVGYDAVLA